jgi:hypothetical protein
VQAATYLQETSESKSSRVVFLTNTNRLGTNFTCTLVSWMELAGLRVEGSAR